MRAFRWKSWSSSETGSTSRASPSFRAARTPAPSWGLPPMSSPSGSSAAWRPRRATSSCWRPRPACCRNIPRLRVLVVGEGQLKRRLQGQARALGISGHVSFVGFRADVAQVYPAHGLAGRPFAVRRVVAGAGRGAGLRAGGRLHPRLRPGRRRRGRQERHHRRGGRRRRAGAGHRARAPGRLRSRHARAARARPLAPTTASTPTSRASSGSTWTRSPRAAASTERAPRSAARREIPRRRSACSHGRGGPSDAGTSTGGNFENAR